MSYPRGPIGTLRGRRLTALGESNFLSCFSHHWLWGMFDCHCFHLEVKASIFNVCFGDMQEGTISRAHLGSGAPGLKSKHNIVLHLKSAHGLEPLVLALGHSYVCKVAFCSSVIFGFHLCNSANSALLFVISCIKESKPGYCISLGMETVFRFCFHQLSANAKSFAPKIP